MTVFESTEPVGVFEQYRPDVYSWAYRLLGHHHDAQDTAQDVFLRWLAQSRRALPNNPRGWLRQVTVNRAIDLLRARRSSPSASDSVPEPAVSSGTDPLEQQELRGAVAAGLERLTEAQRGVLIAKVYDGLTFAQIANELGLAIPTVKTHYLRALAGVRDALSPRWAPERT